MYLEALEAKKELLRRKQLAKFRFKVLCRKVMVNAYWLSAIEDTKMGSNPRRNINIIVRRSARKTILTLKEKSLINKPCQCRTEDEREQLKVVMDSLKCFDMIPPKVRDALAEVCHFLYCSPQRVVLREGHHSSAIYFVIDGEITVSKRVYSIEFGKDVDDVQYALVPGDYFGADGVIFGNRRSVTCTSAIHTELLYIYKEDLSDELRRSLEILWEQIRTSLKRFDYYFGHFTEQQLIECCTFSKVKQYELDSVVYDDDETKRSTTFFLLSGHCSILQYLRMKYKVINNKKQFSLCHEEENNMEDKIEKKSFTAVPSVNKSDKAQNPQNVSQSRQDEMIEKVFVDIATLTTGSIFGIGEVITHRSIVAKTVVQCLEIPRFWLLQRSQNLGNIWQRTKIFYNTTIPSRQLVFDDFVRSFNWRQYREKTIAQLLHVKSK